MKKTMMIAALFAASALAASAAADVYSSNIVGYTKLTLQPGLNMIGGAFLQVGTQAQLDVNELFAGTPNAGPGEDQADTIQTWSNDGTTKKYGTKYYFYDEEGAGEDGQLWYDLQDNLGGEIPTGEGVWYFNSGATANELTLLGECPTNATFTLTLKPGLNMISMPYPVAIGLNSINFDSTYCNAGPGEDQADTIQTWSNDGTTKKYGTKYYFYDEEGAGEDGRLWYDLQDNLGGDLPVGEGFWYNNSGSSDITVTITRPYSLSN